MRIIRPVIYGQCQYTFVMLFLLQMTARERRASAFNASKAQESTMNFSNRDKILEVIFSNYKKHERPSEQWRQPTRVNVNIHILAISSVDVLNMAYNADFYLRQSWLDPRLAWQTLLADSSPILAKYSRSIAISSKMSNLWLPDLFFRNGKEGSMYKMTKPNFLLRLKADGHILFSQKITMRFSCQMHLSNFPMDGQRCDINIGSYGYTLDDLKFVWNDSDAVTQSNNIQISEFDTPLLMNTQDCTGTATTSTGLYSCLKVVFMLKRQLSSYLVSTYIPAILIVMVSWLSFWISVDAVPARVTLGLLTLLGILTQSKGLTESLPRVSYIKAIDIYIIACILFIIGALTEFAVASIHYRGQRNSAWNKWVRQTLREELAKMAATNDNQKTATSGTRVRSSSARFLSRGRSNFLNYFDSEPRIETRLNKNYTVLSLQTKNKKRKIRNYSKRHVSSMSRKNMSEEEELRRLFLQNYSSGAPNEIAEKTNDTDAETPTKSFDPYDPNDAVKLEEMCSFNSLCEQQFPERIIECLSSKPEFADSTEMFDSQLDSYSRFLFPALFLLYNCVYWLYYLIISSDNQ